MPALLAMFGAGIKFLMAYAITRFLLAIGLSYVTYQGMDTLIDNMRSEIEGTYAALASATYDILSMMGADVAISILFSAIAVRLLLVGFSAGVKSGLRFSGITGS